uniref:Secreted protein n=1 Tax=Peronospora matthiolae TaxID=2874970 RepID=A0AAV1UNI2_9STRA
MRGVSKLLLLLLLVLRPSSALLSYLEFRKGGHVVWVFGLMGPRSRVAGQKKGWNEVENVCTVSDAAWCRAMVSVPWRRS